MRADKGREQVAHPRRAVAFSDRLARTIVGHGKYRTEVIGEMPGRRCQRGVVRLQPADHRPDVERRLHGIELI